ncbi:MAG: pilus assembly protein TadG-related protein [Candidatus Omnitrophica bacterium]|nr:pilus assembly protein TadG-related protein [Candidatus Omnitrophota bacterium]
MMRIRYNKSGQISPLFIIIILVLIIALLVTINIGKVSSSKINTANAADAGALAGASQWSCALNFAGLCHTINQLAYAGLIAYLIPEREFFKWYPRRQKWAAKVGMITRTFYQAAKKSVEESNKLARMDAYHYAFINAGIDDQRKWDPITKTYRRKYNPKIETWKQWLMLKSAFAEWLNDLGYPQHNDYPDQYHYPEESYYQRPCLQYKWRNRNTTEYEEIKIEVQTGVLPKAKKLLLPCFGIYYIIICTPGGCYKITFPFFHNFVYAGIRSFEKSHPWIAVTVTHIQPQEDLGLWLVKKSSVKSSSCGKVYKGTQWGWPISTFDLKIVNTDFN